MATLSLWVLSCASGLSFVRWLGHELATLRPTSGSFRSACARLEQVIDAVLAWEERITIGVLPEPELFERIAHLSDPWGTLISQTLHELRAAGAPVLPVLARFRALASSQREVLIRARAVSSQALAQALLCAALNPALSLALYVMLPGVSEDFFIWLGVSLFAFGASLAGGAWIYGLAKNARFGGLKGDERDWQTLAPIALERLLALLQAGVTADRAWIQSIALIEVRAPLLARLWGASIFGDSSSGEPLQTQSRFGMRSAVIALGQDTRRLIQVSLLEGQSCRDRIEQNAARFQGDVRSALERELQLLGTRALSPLFICVAPAALIQVGVGLWICAQAFGF